MIANVMIVSEIITKIKTLKQEKQKDHIPQKQKISQNKKRHDEHEWKSWFKK